MNFTDFFSFLPNFPCAKGLAISTVKDDHLIAAPCLNFSSHQGKLTNRGKIFVTIHCLNPKFWQPLASTIIFSKLPQLIPLATLACICSLLAAFLEQRLVLLHAQLPMHLNNDQFAHQFSVYATNL
jgi:hypothetical protein